MSPPQSPDVSAYVDLTVYDADPSTLYDRYVLNMQSLLPGFNPLPGTQESTIARSLALVIAEEVYAINRLPGATVQTLLQLFGIVRGVGAAASATATFSLTGSSAVDIPAGTQMQLQVGTQTYVFATTADSGTIAAGTTAVTLAVACTTNAAAPNGVPVGTAMTVLSALPWVNSVTLATAPAGGQDPETNQAWLNRGALSLQGLSSALTLPSQFTAAALADTADTVYRATTTANWDPTAGGGAGATAQGVVTVSAMSSGGVMLTSTQQANLLAILQAKALAGLAVYVEDPTVTTVDVACTVWQEPGWTVSQLQANIAAQLASPAPAGAGLSTDLWPFTQSTVRLNDLITVITQTPGVAYVVQMTNPTADVALPGVAPLATLGTVSITVEGP